MRLGDLDALKKSLDEQMNFDENCRDSVFDIIDNAPTVEITEEQAIDKLHETGWLPEHDRQMTENKGDLISCEVLRKDICGNCSAKMDNKISLNSGIREFDKKFADLIVFNDQPQRQLKSSDVHEDV